MIYTAFIIICFSWSKYLSHLFLFLYLNLLHTLCVLLKTFLWNPLTSFVCGFQFFFPSGSFRGKKRIVSSLVLFWNAKMICCGMGLFFITWAGHSVIPFNIWRLCPVVLSEVFVYYFFYYFLTHYIHSSLSGIPALWMLDFSTDLLVFVSLLSYFPVLVFSVLSEIFLWLYLPVLLLILFSILAIMFLISKSSFLSYEYSLLQHSFLFQWCSGLFFFLFVF